MELLQQFLHLLDELNPVFRQRRTATRARSLMLAALLCLGRRWITRIICTRGRDHQDWSADYKLFSRCQWQSAALFEPVIRHTLPYFGTGPILLAGDETRAQRGGRKVKRSRWMRDPMSPPFHVNFIKGIRFLQISALLPLYHTHPVGCRAVPVSFQPVDLPAKPGKNASKEELLAYHQACRKNNMCVQAVQQLGHVRDSYDAAGAADKLIVVGLDGGFCNRTVFGGDLPPRTVVLARTRKDAVLCRPANHPGKRNRIYGKKKFTPEKVLRDPAVPWSETTVFYGGQLRSVRYKQVAPVLWQGGARRQRLRLLVVAPTPYQLSPGAPTYYRQPSFLLVNDNDVAVEILLQAYFDRWQIEVNHRDEKQLIGIVDPQVWNDQSVDRQPPFMVVAYSFLLLAALLAYGPERTHHYIESPSWQRRKRRPSCLDLINLLRQQATDHPDLFNKVDFQFDPRSMLTKSAA